MFFTFYIYTYFISHKFNNNTSIYFKTYPSLLDTKDSFLFTKDFRIGYIFIFRQDFNEIIVIIPTNSIVGIQINAYIYEISKTKYDK